MSVLPLYGVLVAPGVNIHVKKEEYEEIALKPPQMHEDVVIILAQESKPRYTYTKDDFYARGVRGWVSDVAADGFVTIHLNARVGIEEITIHDDATIDVAVHELPEINDVPEEERIARLTAIKQALENFSNNYSWGEKVLPFIEDFATIEAAGVFLSPWLSATAEERYRVLSYGNKRGRMECIEQIIYSFIEVARSSAEAMEMQKYEYEQTMREQTIRRQIEVLENELHEMHPEEGDELDQFAARLEALPLGDEARAEANKVLRRLRQENGQGNEYALLYDYMEYFLSLPWEREEASDFDLDEAERILNEDHYGLKKVKQRVVEELAVMKLTKKQAGSILLFVGAPGTGKTSVGQSIGRALGRTMVRVSLGGVRDEADIRGHRRTYIGAMAGRIIDGIVKAGVSNPVVVLDEVDKMSVSYNGDPASALLEVLDPEQNMNFVDHYINAPFDLSDVLFVCTANTTDTIPEPLLNRMEVIEFKSYTLEEKLGIARSHLIKKACQKNGLPENALILDDEVLTALIRDYTMEAGVRGLRKRLDTLCRRAAVRMAKGEEGPFTLTESDLHPWLDMQPVLHESVLKEKRPGVVTGLAWTSFGGDILFIETLLTKGSGKLMLTGKLGDVMKESAQLALSLVKSLFPDKADIFKNNDIHIHVPDGAVPKDGPSAGITLVTALASLVSERAVDPHIAMTGEVALRGSVTAIGGLNEKLAAASRSGITTVFIPKENERDLEDIDHTIKDALTIIPVDNIQDVLTQTGVME